MKKWTLFLWLCYALFFTNQALAQNCNDPNSHNQGDPLPCETCFDFVQNGDEEGVDCGGTNPNCPACPPTPTAYRLDVEGNALITDDTLTIVNIGGNGDGDFVELGMLENTAFGNETGIKLEYDGFANKLGFVGYTNGTKNTEILTINRNGRVGINIDNPKQTLDIGGDMALSDGTGRIGFYEGSTEKALLSYNGSTLEMENRESGGDMYFDTNDDMFFRTNNLFRMALNSEGKLGVGTTIPSHDISIKQRSTTNYSTSGLKIEEGNSSSNWSIYMNQDDNDLSFRYNNVLRAYIQDGSGSFAITSDRRLKENIEPIEDILRKVLQLKPSTYYYKSDEERENKSIGFISQEVEEVFPEMIAEHEGIKGLVYDNFAVLSIKAIQEQQELIEELQEENKNLKNRLAKIEAALFGKGKANTTTTDDTGTIVLSDAQLLDNQPNPFTESTILRYFIPETVTQAELHITNANGDRLKVIPIDAKGEGQVILEAQALSSGSYFYSLVLDGKVFATKQMVLTK
jgi:hypothetical protein